MECLPRIIDFFPLLSSLLEGFDRKFSLFDLEILFSVLFNYSIFMNSVNWGVIAGEKCGGNFYANYSRSVNVFGWKRSGKVS